jgi:NADH-quinone oxidoreductase subunit M
LALVVGAKARLFGSTKFFILCVLFIELALLIAFSTVDLFLFYVTFEALTIPTFLLIYIYGADIMKLRAAKHFLVYSFLSSTFMNIGIATLYNLTLSTSIEQIIFKLNTTVL